MNTMKKLYAIFALGLIAHSGFAYTATDNVVDVTGADFVTLQDQSLAAAEDINAANLAGAPDIISALTSPQTILFVAQNPFAMNQSDMTTGLGAIRGSLTDVGDIGSISVTGASSNSAAASSLGNQYTSQLISEANTHADNSSNLRNDYYDSVHNHQPQPATASETTTTSTLSTYP